MNKPTDNHIINAFLSISGRHLKVDRDMCRRLIHSKMYSNFRFKLAFEEETSRDLVFSCLGHRVSFDAYSPGLHNARYIGANGYCEGSLSDKTSFRNHKREMKYLSEYIALFPQLVKYHRA